MRADSAAYQADIINWCMRNHVQFAIGAKQDVAVKAAIDAIADADWQACGDGQIASTVHCMNETEAFTLIVFRKGKQLSMEQHDTGWRYHAIATNRSDDAATVLQWYRLRGEYSENRIKDLKPGFGMERMPCGRFSANSVFFRIGVMAYNLFVMFSSHALPEGWKRHQVQTTRWRLYLVAARIVRHARSLWVKVPDIHIKLFHDIRR